MKLTWKQKRKIKNLYKKPGEAWQIGRYFLAFYTLNEYVLILIGKNTPSFRFFSTKKVFAKIENYKDIEPEFTEDEMRFTVGIK